MTPTPTELAQPQNFGWRYQGGGLFSEVYSKEFNEMQIGPFPTGPAADLAVGPTMTVIRHEKVLKVAKCADGTMDFIEWCYLRMKKFGKGSAEMSGLPEVEAFGRTSERVTNARNLVYGFDEGDATHGWWCIMPRYDSARAWSLGDLEMSCKDLIRKLEEIFYPGFCNDLHPGNFMYDRARDQVVIIDPCKNGAKEDANARRQEGFSISTAIVKREEGALRIQPCQCAMCRGVEPAVVRAEKQMARDRVALAGRAWKVNPFMFDKFDKEIAERMMKDLWQMDLVKVFRDEIAKPVQPSPRKQAAWKRQPIQNLFHMQGN